MTTHSSSVAARTSKLVPVIVILALVLIGGAVAIWLFRVPKQTVLSIDFIVLMMVSHLLMHLGHGAHAGSQAEDVHAGHVQNALTTKPGADNSQPATAPIAADPKGKQAQDDNGHNHSCC